MKFLKHCCSRAFAAAFCLALSLFMNACSVFGPVSSSSVNYFDLGTPAGNAPAGIRLKIENLRSETAIKYKMLYRVSKSKLTLDENNKWTQTPDAMLTRYLQLSLLGGTENTDSAPQLTLGGTLLLFEINFEEKKAELALDYNIRDSEGKILKSSSARFSSPFKKKSPEEFAASMADAASKLADQLRVELTELAKKEAAKPPVQSPKTLPSPSDLKAIPKDNK